MENEEQIGYGIPRCACGQCIEELVNSDDIMDLSILSLKRWFSGWCPASPNPIPPSTDPGSPMRMAA